MTICTCEGREHSLSERSKNNCAACDEPIREWTPKELAEQEAKWLRRYGNEAALSSPPVHAPDGTTWSDGRKGLTKREYLAAHAGYGMVCSIAEALADFTGEPHACERDDDTGRVIVPDKVLAQRYARAAVMYADALLAELAK